MKIGILETGHIPDSLSAKYGDYPAMFEKLLADRGFDFETFTVVDGIFPRSVQSAEGWLITGSKHATYENLPWIPPLESFIRKAMREKVPVAGICFGHQIMAQALGGRSEKFAGGWAAGSTRYRTGTDDDIMLNALHQDQVVAAPSGAEIILANRFCPIAGLRYGRHGIGIQPHPEFSNRFTADLIQFRGDAIPQETAASALTAMGNRNDSPLIADMLSDFFVGDVSPAARREIG